MDRAAEYDHYINFLADAMRYKLEINSHKGWIGDIPLSDLLSKLRGEVEELEEAIKKGNRIDMILESADVSNFALAAVMVAINMKGNRNDTQGVEGTGVHQEVGGSEKGNGSISRGTSVLCSGLLEINRGGGRVHSAGDK